MIKDRNTNGKWSLNKFEICVSAISISFPGKIVEQSLSED